MGWNTRRKPAAPMLQTRHVPAARAAGPAHCSAAAPSLRRSRFPSFFSAYSTLSAPRMHRAPHGYPPRSAAGTANPVGPGSATRAASLLNSPSPARPRRLRISPPAVRPGSAGSHSPAHSGSGGSAEPAGEAVPGGDTRCGQHGSL